MTELRDSSMAGCHFCHIRWQAIEPVERELLIKECFEPAQNNYQAIHETRLCFRCLYATHSGWASSSFAMMEFNDIDFPDMSSSTDYQLSSASPHTFSTIKSWIKTCTETHTSCRRAMKRTPTLTATRLLDLGTQQDSYLKLVKGECLGQRPRYITLSHCWGGYMPLRLTNASFGQFCKGIDLAMLPKTFEDAVDISKRLGVRYLWIDSLCIIQDSVQDWQKESMKMADIYEQACAILQQRSPWTRSDHNYVLFDAGIWYTNIRNSRLMKRGWVQQEQFLSVRSIHFARTQVFWRCLELKACEGFPAGFPSNGKVVDQLGSIIGTKLEAFDSGLKHCELWRSIVRDYSSCELSMPEKDKLMAISGLARRFGDGKDYLAGLWRPILPSQLLWRIHPSQTVASTTQSQARRSPSWSWVSVDLPIDTYCVFDLGADSLIDIHKAETSLTSDDDFGQATHGVIQLSGFIGRVKTLLNSQLSTNSKSASAIESISHARDDFGARSNGSVVYVLPIRQAFVSYDPGTTFMNEFCTLWIEPTGRVAGEYTRRGYIQFGYGIEGGVSYLNNFAPFLRRKLDNNCFERYDGENEKGYHHYTISLV
ncbi:HET-domain-containing protein [Acephala macrosclerotiorum]|nr:HET-domain-containing protein [Acephala macrosclerotiorum]